MGLPFDEVFQYKDLYDNYKDTIESNIRGLARLLYVHQDFDFAFCFRCALEFFEYQHEFMNDADTIHRIEALAQKKAALVTTPKQQENESTKVVDSQNSTQI